MSLRNPDGSPAADVPVKIDVGASTEKSWEGTTDSEGAVVSVFNIHKTTAGITIEVSIHRQLIKGVQFFFVRFQQFSPLVPIGVCRWPRKEESNSTVFIST